MKKSLLCRFGVLALTGTLLLPACGGSSGGTAVANTDTVSTAETQPAETAPTTDGYGRELVETALPALDFSGTSLTLFCRNDQGFEYEFDVTAVNGDVMNDTVYARNQTVEERLNCKLVFKAEKLNGGKETAVLETAILAGEGAYDLAAVHSSYGAKYAAQGYYINLNQVTYTDFSKPWWNDDLNKELNVYGYLPFAYGSACLSGTMRAVVTFFNKDKYEQYFKNSDMYSIVKEGKWTMDKLYEMADSVYVDVNGDGKRDNGDFYCLGMMQQATPMDAFVASLDLAITTTNKDGIPELSLNSEHTINAIEKLKKLLNENKGVITMPYNNTSATAANELILGKFQNSEVIFTFNNLYYTDSLRDFEDDYGILPMPKYDEDQKGYYTLPHNAFSLLAVPLDAKDFKKSDALMEAFSEETYRTVIPVYFETALKSKYLRDSESAQMFDLIMEGVHINFGSAYQKHCIGAIGELIRDLSKDFASTYATNEAKYKTALGTLLTNLQKAGEGK